MDALIRTGQVVTYRRRAGGDLATRRRILDDAHVDHHGIMPAEARNGGCTHDIHFQSNDQTVFFDV